MRRGLLVVLIVLVALLVSVGVVSAQDEDNLCAGENLAVVAEMLEGTAAALREGSEDIPTLLVTARLFISYVIADCSGLTFSSEVDGLQPTLGPFVLEPGTYIATATTTGSIIAEFTVLDGECGEGNRMGESIFILGRDQASDGAEVVVQSEGCEVLFSISNTREPWTIAFEQIR